MNTGPAGQGARAGATAGAPARQDAPLHWLRVCPSAAVAEGSPGLRFELPLRMRPTDASAPQQAAFLLRLDGEPRAFVNRCAHVPVELDWPEGQFLEKGARVIVCPSHEARYDARDGRCLGGPCRGEGLQVVPAREVDGWIEVAWAIRPQEPGSAA